MRQENQRLWPGKKKLRLERTHPWASLENRLMLKQMGGHQMQGRERGLKDGAQQNDHFGKGVEIPG
jgi:hypothetical protein